METTKTLEMLTITDETIVKFYEANPQLNIVTMNHLIINCLQKLSSNSSDTTTTTTNDKILYIVTNIEYKVDQLIQGWNNRRLA